MNLHEALKEGSAAAHQRLEKLIVSRLKAIKNEQDYIDLLRPFYGYFRRLEEVTAPFITGEVLPDRAQRRNSTFLANDIHELGGSVEDLPVPFVTPINNSIQALGAWYVMEGSVLGGQVIVQLLKRKGIHRGLSFFTGYEQDTAKKWASLLESLDRHIPFDAQQDVIETVVYTFYRFGIYFDDYHFAMTRKQAEQK